MIPYGLHHIDEKDINAVEKVLRSRWLTTGPHVVEFEKKFAKYVGAKYAVAVCNGTAALLLAVAAADIERGSEGLTSPITFLASANSMIYNGIKPNFADIDPKTYNISPLEIAKKMSHKTKLIIPVHFAGQPCEMEKIKKIAGKKAVIIEDASHAIGSRYKNGKAVGSCFYSDMTIFSFHPVKTITTGEGGMITTNSKKLHERLQVLRNHGMIKQPGLLSQNPGPWYYEMQALGFNFRLTDFQASLGISQLKKLNKFVRRRREIVKKYNLTFSNIPWIKTPFEQKNVFSAFHIYVLLIDFKMIGKSRKQVMLDLSRKGIQSQVHYIPVHLQPYYRKTFGFTDNDYPESEFYYSCCLSIPLYPNLTNTEISKITKTVSSLCNKKEN